MAVLSSEPYVALPAIYHSIRLLQCRHYLSRVHLLSLLAKETKSFSLTAQEIVLWFRSEGLANSCYCRYCKSREKICVTLG